jgi:hypothetical protein
LKNTTSGYSARRDRNHVFVMLKTILKLHAGLNQVSRQLSTQFGASFRNFN